VAVVPREVSSIRWSRTYRSVNGCPSTSFLEAVPQLAYDRLVEQQAPAGTPPPPETASGYVAMPRWVSAVITAVGVPGGLGIILVLFPWLITHFQTGTPLWPLAVRALGVALIVLGVLVNIVTFVRFPVEGIGTPFPTDPRRRAR
jgi:hypothetical protein